MGGNRLIYVMLPLRSEDEWLLYKSCASELGLKSVTVVAEVAPLPSEEIIVDPIAVEHVSQEELHGATQRVSLGSELAKTNSEALNLAVVTYEFDEGVDTEAYVEKDDEVGIGESNEENVQPIVDTAPDAPVVTVDKGNEPNDLTCSHIN
jgi:hypothetical protein